MRLKLLLIIFAVLLLVGTRPCGAHSRPFAIQVHDLSEGHFSVSLYQRRTGRLVWRRLFLGVERPTWSRDGLALAFATGPQHYGYRTDSDYIVTWRQGDSLRVRKHDQPKVPFDYVEDFLWSPNDRGVLFRTGGSGMADEDWGCLWCLDVVSGRFFDITGTRGAVRRMVWTNNRSVKYWFVDMLSDTLLPPSDWRRPSK